MPRLPIAHDVLPERVTAAVGRTRGVSSVHLVGSRAEGRATALSDWDFLVRTDEFAAVRRGLPRTVRSLDPVVAQWDRLSRTWCYMLILEGPHKIDLIFAEPHIASPPWTVRPSNLAGIDAHFWDWMLWLRSKQATGNTFLVREELEKLHAHLLGPMGVGEAPTTVLESVEAYLAVRSAWERRFDLSVSRRPQRATESTITSP
jgi:Nucleotidyltransferase domain